MSRKKRVTVEIDDFPSEAELTRILSEHRADRPRLAGWPMTINELSALLWGISPNQPQDTGWFDYLEVTRRVLRKRDGTTLTMYRCGNKVNIFERFSGQALCEHYEALATPEAVDVYCDTVAERYLRGQVWP